MATPFRTPKPQEKKLVGFRCDGMLARRIEEAATREDREISSWIRNACRAALGEQARATN